MPAVAILFYVGFVFWMDPLIGYEVIRTSNWSYWHDIVMVLGLMVWFTN